MPRNVQDFKDHPYYALERHLKRNEVIHPKREVGKVSSGKAASTLESIYRRKDVKLVRSADKWYRLGREIRPGESPLKHAAPQRHRRRASTPSDAASDHDSDRGAALYAETQTEIYVPPPVIRGRIIKNAYGNLDVYVPTMIPAGGVHVRAPEAARIAKHLGVDYADAVVGFEFRGRHGTAVIQGVIVPREQREAVERGVREARRDRIRKKAAAENAEALRLWVKFLKGLRIRARIMGHKVDGAEESGVDDGEEGGFAALETEEEQDEGGFLPDDAGGPVARPTAVVSDVGDEDVDAGAGHASAPRRRREQSETSDFEPSISSPWDRPVAAWTREPSPEHGRVKQEQEAGGGFVPEDADNAGGFVRDDDDDDEDAGALRHEDLGGGGTTLNDQEGSFEESAGRNVEQHDTDEADDGGGGFVVDDAEMEAHHGEAGRSENSGGKTAPSRTTSDGSPWLRSHKTPSAKAEVALDLPIQTQSPGGSDGSDADSMLSHDPDDEEAEPDWLVDDVGL